MGEWFDNARTNFSVEDRHWMGKALVLAERGKYTTHPNPRVGCIIVRDGRKVGEGAHLVAGGPHAEIIALREAGEYAQGATAYVTLEPCAHTGRTPPCTQALIASGVMRVVAAMRDPFGKVDGRGFSQLQAAGIAVNYGLLQAEASELNIGFLHRVRTGRPWIRLKVAMSLDGRVAMASGESKWITGAASREDVHSYRAQSDAVITGIGTVLADDPSLTARGVGMTVIQPTRVVLDRRCRISPKANVLDDVAPTLVFHNDAHAACQGRYAWAPLDREGDLDLTFIVAELGNRYFNEALIECGPTLSSSFLKLGLVDELLIYQAPCLLGHLAKPMNHLNMETLKHSSRFQVVDTLAMGNDLRIRLRPSTNEVTNR